MNKRIIRIAVYPAAVGLLAALLAGCQSAQEKGRGAIVILSNPKDSVVELGGTATFEVAARARGQTEEKTKLTYQWFRNGEPIPEATRDELVIRRVSTNDVALYTCRVSLERKSTETKPASLMMYVPSAAGAPFPVFGTPVHTSGQSGCGSPCGGKVNYNAKWWVPDTGTTHTAADPQSTSTKVEYVGKRGDEGCGTGKVALPSHPPSAGYHFTIYFPAGTPVPTKAYAILLTGFIQ